jgi:4-hydroxy-4-methyl-2-oxoglutarate aldolase
MDNTHLRFGYPNLPLNISILRIDDVELLDFISDGWLPERGDKPVGRRAHGICFALKNSFERNKDMLNRNLLAAFQNLSTPLIADACLRLKLPLRLAPPGIRPVSPGFRLAGRVLPAQHYGSVDIFLEAMESAEPGDVLVIDNGGRMDEGCIGDLTILEAQANGIAGIAVWGVHRDTAELERIGFPVFSYGVYPAGPRRLDPAGEDALTSARFGDLLVGKADVVFGDRDGVLFATGKDIEKLIETARVIFQTERVQAQAIRAGKTLREQLRFSEYLKLRSEDPAYTFRKHLRKLGGAIEE